MIEIKVDEQVLAALRRAFPKPANSAQRALNKYVSTLKHLLIQSLSRGVTPIESKLNAFSVSLQELANKGGQIGKKKMRLHAWLRENDFSLVEPVEIGSNLTGMVSKVKFTDLVTLEWHEPEVEADSIIIDGISINNDLLQDPERMSREVFLYLYPDYEVSVADGYFEEMFDSLDVDIKSLQNYISWLLDETKHYKKSKRDQYLLQARLILTVAQFTGGQYFQRKIHSDFGRTYYRGTSIQNVNKDLRRAILGDCWEYDVRSSVVTWKMGFAEEYVQTLARETTVHKEFSVTLAYLRNKTAFMKNVQRAVFDRNCDHAEELQMKMLKQAFTALSFGARHSSHGWMNKNGEWETASIAEIFKRVDERERFMYEFHVISFVKEQSALDDYLHQGVIKNAPDLLKLAYLKTSSGRPSKPKVIAYLYQHEETQVMNIVREALKDSNHIVLANIHDAIVVRQRLSEDTQQEIQFRMRDLTGNPYWVLSGKQIKRWRPSLKSAIAEEQLHRQRIQEEEALAKGFAITFDSDH